MIFLQRIRILPVLVIVAVISLIVRTDDFFDGLNGQAFAQQEPETPEENHEAPTTDELILAENTAQDDLAADTAPDFPKPPAIVVEKSEDDHAEEMQKAKDNEAIKKAKQNVGKGWRDSTETAYTYSRVQAELYEDLAKRRQDLERRERELDQKQALLDAAEKELNQKVKELTAIKAQIETAMGDQSEQQKKRIDSLVKIYEGMKSKDAARIFDTLEMDILIDVMAKMSERRSAPILASMNPERARAVTILLAQQNQLPSLPQ